MSVPLHAAPPVSPSVSVVIGTRNRSASLRRLVASLRAGIDRTAFEVIVVDNGSTDATRSVVAELAQSSGPSVRYAFEPRPGVAYARNRGASEARAPILAFADDDQQAAPDWVSVIRRAFEAEAGLHFIAGRVLPPPGAVLPEWVTSRTRGAISIIDRGDAPVPVDAEHWMCLPGGNMACRRDVFEAMGGFRPFPRSQDRELTVRLLQAGYIGRYVPEMLMYHDVDAARITPGYFRKWVATEGRMRARYRFDELFDASGRLLPAPHQGRRLFGVSTFVYRQLLIEVARWARAAMRGRRVEAFGHELRARYLSHYVVGALNLSSELSELIGRMCG
jgi:glycosyltransferase involved in cell wall biosynthesis